MHDEHGYGLERFLGLLVTPPDLCDQEVGERRLCCGLVDGH